MEDAENKRIAFEKINKIKELIIDVMLNHHKTIVDEKMRESVVLGLEGQLIAGLTGTLVTISDPTDRAITITKIPTHILTAIFKAQEFSEKFNDLMKKTAEKKDLN